MCLRESPGCKPWDVGAAEQRAGGANGSRSLACLLVAPSQTGNCCGQRIWVCCCIVSTGAHPPAELLLPSFSPPTLPVQSAALPSEKCIFWETCGVPCVCPPRSNCVLLRPVTIKAHTVILCGALSLRCARHFHAREKTAFRVGNKAFKFRSPGSLQLCQGAARGKELVEMLARGPAGHHTLHGHPSPP